MKMEFEPYAKYGVKELILVTEIREKIQKLEYWDTITKLMEVVLICSDFEVSWRVQDNRCHHTLALSRMDEAWNKLDNMDLFLLNDILWRIERL